MVKCWDSYPLCLREIGSTNEHPIHTWTSQKPEVYIEANDEFTRRFHVVVY